MMNAVTALLQCPTQMNELSRWIVAYYYQGDFVNQDKTHLIV